MKKSLEELKQFIIANLGKSIKGGERYKGQELMIVGYCTEDRMFTICDLAILSLTSEDRWTEIGKEDYILLHSPLNKSFTYMDIDLLKEILNEQEKRTE